MMKCAAVSGDHPGTAGVRRWVVSPAYHTGKNRSSQEANAGFFLFFEQNSVWRFFSSRKARDQGASYGKDRDAQGAGGKKGVV